MSNDTVESWAADTRREAQSTRLQRRIDNLALQLQMTQSTHQREHIFGLILRLTEDRRLEYRIEAEAWKLSVAKTETDQRAAFEALQRLIEQRTPERMQEMERERRDERVVAHQPGREDR